MKMLAVTLLSALVLPGTAAAGQCPEHPTLEPLVACYGDQSDREDVEAAPRNAGTRDPGRGREPAAQPASGAGESDC